MNPLFSRHTRPVQRADGSKCPMSDLKPGDRVFILASVEHVAGHNEVYDETILKSDYRDIIHIRGLWLARDLDHVSPGSMVQVCGAEPTLFMGVVVNSGGGGQFHLGLRQTEALFGICPEPGQCIKIEGGWRQAEIAEKEKAE